MTSEVPSQHNEIDWSFLYMDGGVKDLVPLKFEQNRADLEHEIRKADHIIIGTGGNKGRLGESVVETGPAIEGMLRGLEKQGKRGTPVTIVIDNEARDLFDVTLYREKFWQEITIIEIPSSKSNEKVQELARSSTAKNVIVFDFNGGNDGFPGVAFNTDQTTQKHITQVARLFRTAVIGYARHGEARRYADFIEDLLRIPRYSLPGQEIQPTILLSDSEKASLPQLLDRLKITTDRDAIRVICGFQTAAAGKSYDIKNWKEVIRLLAQKNPQQKYELLIAAGPTDAAGINIGSLRTAFAEFKVDSNNIRVTVEALSIRDLAILASREAAQLQQLRPPIALANDSFVAHLVGASGSHVTTPYLPGEYWSMNVWASTPNNHGVTITSDFEPVDLDRAINFGEKTVINRILPQVLADEVALHLP